VAETFGSSIRANRPETRPAGYNLVIAHGSQYGGLVQQLAPQFPKTSFAWGTAGVTYGMNNVFAYQANSQEGGYVEGYMAALLSKSKVLGVIGPIDVGDAHLFVVGFKAGALAADPTATVHASFTGSFSDDTLMETAAKAYVSEHADVLTGSSQSVVGAIGVAKQDNVAWFGTQWNQASLAPSQVVACQVYNWTGVLTQIISEVDPRTTGREAIGLMMAGVSAGQGRSAGAQGTQGAHGSGPAHQSAPDRPVG
jgi:basic membrane lipoprotein Med (substrate-binding protein (PBP1-ABC) superfamily)